MLKWRPACKAVLSEAFVTGGEALGGKYGGAAACKAVPRHQLRHNKVLSSRQFSYCLRPGTVSRVTNASLSIAFQAIPPHETGCERFAIPLMRQAIPLTPFSDTYLPLVRPACTFFTTTGTTETTFIWHESARVLFTLSLFFLLSLKTLHCLPLSISKFVSIRMT